MSEWISQDMIEDSKKASRDATMEYLKIKNNGVFNQCEMCRRVLDDKNNEATFHQGLGGYFHPTCGQKAAYYGIKSQMCNGSFR